MYYIDTSILAAYYCPEKRSDQVQALLMAQTQPAISRLTSVELISAVSRKVRTGELNKRDGNRITSQFRVHIDSELYTVLPIEIPHWQMACDWLGRFNTPLRTLDALHLSISFSNNLTLLTSDHHLAVAANDLGVPYKSI